jgi:hypothetical protein
MGSVNRRITAHAHVGINVRPYLRKQKNEKGLEAWLK